MSIATLADIVTKVRKLTGTGNALQLTDANIIDYINSFYLYDFPAEFRTLHLKQLFTFNTIQNIDTYPFDFEHYDVIESPVFIDKREVPIYYNPSSFYGLFYNWQFREAFDTGDGVLDSTYSGTVLSAPIIRSYNNKPKADSQTLPTAAFATGSYPPSFAEPNPSRAQNILISANTATSTLFVTDDGNGNLIGDVAAGTIDYQTGAITGLQFTTGTTIPSGNEIKISYNPTNQARPQAILFWQNQLTVRPVPDEGYQVEITAHRKPSQILLGSVDPTKPTNTGVPELLEWWETLAAGASKKVFEDRQDADGIALMDKMLAERYALNESRTYAQLGKQRIQTIYSNQYDYTSNGVYGWGSQNG